MHLIQEGVKEWDYYVALWMWIVEDYQEGVESSMKLLSEVGSGTGAEIYAEWDNLNYFSIWVKKYDNLPDS